MCVWCSNDACGRYALPLLTVCLMPVYISKFFLDIDLLYLEVFLEERPRNIKHFSRVEVDVDGEKLVSLLLSELEPAVVVVGEVESVLELCLGVGSIGVKADGSIHDLRVVLACLLSADELLET